VLNRAEGPAGLLRGGQKYLFWDCGKVRDSTKYFWNLGCGMTTVRYGIWRMGFTFRAWDLRQGHRVCFNLGVRI
jgi:hypothetical protein